MAPALPDTTDHFTLTFPEGRESREVLREAFDQTRMAMCITDPHVHDNPIVYVNGAFERLTGYAAAECMGRNCRFLQGTETEESALEELREAIRAKRVVVVELLNHRRDGRPFWNALHVGPVYDQHGRLRYFFGSQWDVTDVREARDREVRVREAGRRADDLRLRELFGVVSSIVALSAAGAATPREASERARERIAALARAHRSAEGPPAARTSITALIEGVLDPLGADGDAVRRLTLNGPRVDVLADAVTPLGLVIHELARRSLEGGALAAGGTAELRWRTDGERLHMEWNEAPGGNETGGAGDDGAEMDHRILDATIGTLNGTIARDGAGGVRIDLPCERVLHED